MSLCLYPLDILDRSLAQVQLAPLLQLIASIIVSFSSVVCIKDVREDRLRAFRRSHRHAKRPAQGWCWYSDESPMYFLVLFELFFVDVRV